MTQLMRQSVHISLQAMKCADPDCLDMIYLLALLPGGILARDLDIIWKAYKDLVNQDKQHISAINVSYVSVPEGEEYNFY